MGLLAHEMVHVIQLEKPMSICWSMQEDHFMVVFADTSGLSTEEIEAFRLYTEKWATIAMESLWIIFGFLLGVAFVSYYQENK